MHLPEPNTIWKHRDEPPRRVVEVCEDSRRVRWDRAKPWKKQTPKWVAYSTWERWVKDAVQVDDWPPRPPRQRVKDQDVPRRGTGHPVVDLEHRHPALKGVLVPWPLPWPKQRDACLRAASMCMSRNVHGAEMARALDVSLDVVHAMTTAIRTKYEKLPPNFLAVRREQQFHNSQRIFDLAMSAAEDMVTDSETGMRRRPADGKEFAAVLKVANDAVKSMRAQVGADRGLEAGGETNNTNITVNAAISQTTVVEQQLGISVEQLKSLAQGTAVLLSDQSREKEGIAVEAVG